ncbi:hypothetical protein [Dactylococcopsis salina]|nr:hypothetical protein [Dactylococcopsis salina]
MVSDHWSLITETSEAKPNTNHKQFPELDIRRWHGKVKMIKRSMSQGL